MGPVTFDKLYENYNVLSDAKDKVSEHSKEYLESIEGAKGGEKEKKLAAQIISKFFKHFPSLQGRALNAVFDICEDDNSTIRIAAMKTLPTLFKECKNKETGTTVAGILAQLLQLDEPQEYNVASNSLFHILKEDPLNTIKSIFKQIQESDNLLRDKCIKFLIAKVKILEKSVYTTEIEDYVINETKQLLQDASSDEYISLMPFLMSTRLGNSLSGQQELIEMTAQQIEIDRDLPPENLDKNLDRLVTCVKFILPYFSPKIDSAKFVKYICDRILPHWEYLSSLSNGSVLQLALLRELAELSLHCGKLENPSLYVVQIFDKLKYYMPLPPEDTEIKNIPNFEFTAIEALLYSFHKLARQCPDFLTHDPSVLKDFRTRLMYLSRGVQGCQKALNSSDNLKDKVLSPDEMKKLKITPKLLSNINTLIKDLFYQPPMYKATVSLSYRLNDENLAAKVVTEKATITAPKRHVPITFESNGSTPNKQNRSNRPGENQKLYAPPSGKFSNNLNYDTDRKSGNRFRGGRGGGRNQRRPQGRNWRK